MFVFLVGGPGSGKGTQCQRIVQRYPDFVHISMGDVIREEISTKGTADDKWGMISTLVSKGEMAPEVRCKSSWMYVWGVMMHMKKNMSNEN